MRAEPTAAGSDEWDSRRVGSDESPTRPNLTSPAAVLWDMDGTLVDSEKVWTVSLDDTARRLGGRLSAAARVAIIGSNLPRTLGILFDDLGLAPEPERTAEAERMILDRTAELFRAGLEWRPGAQAALRMVRDAGWPTALVTNTGRELTELALDGIGREHFSVIVCCDEAGDGRADGGGPGRVHTVPRGKPDPDPYLRAAELLGVAATHCLAVEDSPTGALAAERAGAAVLVVPCEVPVPSGPGRILRDSLRDLSADEVRLSYTRARRDRAA